MGYEIKGIEAISDDFPLLPKSLSPLDYRLRGDNRDSKFWESLALECEKSGDFGEAYHYWLAAANSCRNSDEIAEYESNAEEMLMCWRYNK